MRINDRCGFARQDNSAVGPQHPPPFAQCLLYSGQVMQHAPCSDDVDTPPAKRQVLDIRLQQGVGTRITRAIEHPGRKVRTDHAWRTPVTTDRATQAGGVPTGATADVEDHFAGTESPPEGTFDFATSTSRSTRVMPNREALVVVVTFVVMKDTIDVSGGHR